MKVFVYNRYLDLSPNVTLIKKWDCRECGKKNKPNERIDTQVPLGGAEVSFCIYPCWMKKLHLI